MTVDEAIEQLRQISELQGCGKLPLKIALAGDDGEIAKSPDTGLASSVNPAGKIICFDDMVVLTRE